MLINCFILAISSSIDSLGIGVTYGIKDKKISFSSTIILFIISLLVSFISVFFGKILLDFLPEFITELIGCFILFIIGFFVIVKSFFEKKSGNQNDFDFNILILLVLCFLVFYLFLLAYGNCFLFFKILS